MLFKFDRVLLMEFWMVSRVLLCGVAWVSPSSVGFFPLVSGPAGENGSFDHEVQYQHTLLNNTHDLRTHSNAAGRHTLFNS